MEKLKETGSVKDKPISKETMKIQGKHFKGVHKILIMK